MSRNSRYANTMGLAGAFLGGLSSIKLQWETQRAQEAEIAKERRLEQILMAREGRQEQRDVARDERAFAQQDKVLDSQQQHAVALVGLNHEYKTIEEAQAAGYRMDQIRLQGEQAMGQIAAQGAQQRQTNAEDARVRAETRVPEGTYVSDGTFVPVGQNYPTGTSPTVGFGATNLGVRGGQGGAAGGRPGTGQDNPVPVTSREQASSLPPGTWIKLPNGQVGQR